DVWFCKRNVQKPMAKMRPRYLERSAVSMRNAMNLMTQRRGLAPPPPIRSAQGHPSTRSARSGQALLPREKAWPASGPLPGERVVLTPSAARGKDRVSGRGRIPCEFLYRPTTQAQSIAIREAAAHSHPPDSAG